MSGITGTESLAPIPETMLKVLVVDDDLTNRMVLNAILVKESYQVVMAENGEQAIEAFDRWAPDLVLMDIMMPVMDGYEATHAIKSRQSDRFVPIIFLTALTDEKSLARCVSSGGDGFLTKPYNRVILKAKIDALMRVRDLYDALRARNAELGYHHERLQQEHDIAERVFANILQPASLRFAGIKYLLSPMAIANGDVLLVAKKPDGGYHYLLGDFTGHGLSAAIGAMPLSEIFYTMTHKGYHIAEIVSEINQRLHATLPTGLFCAACLIEFDIKTRRISVWNGGVPDVLIGAAGGVRARLGSRHLPLGILPKMAFDNTLEFFEVASGDRIYVYSDGVIEAVNPRGEMFGQASLEAMFGQQSEPTVWFDDVCQALERFGAGAEQSDDITLLEIDVDCFQVEPAAEKAAAGLPVVEVAGEWRVSLSLDATALTRLDPVPNLVQMLVDIQGLEQHRERLFIILAELYNNALEHGVLRLDSSIKQSPEGFGEYYAAREQGLKSLHEGWIKIDVEHQPCGEGGRFRVRVEDSGEGFDAQAVINTDRNGLAHSGRGITLLKNLCNEVFFHGRGNSVEAVYVWSGQNGSGLDA